MNFPYTVVCPLLHIFFITKPLNYFQSVDCSLCAKSKTQQKSKMKPPIELNRPTILNIIAIVSYCLATMFHIIAYATDNWASMMLDNVRWRFGLWQGCREEDEHCTTDIFQHKVFQTGTSKFYLLLLHVELLQLNILKYCFFNLCLQ